MQETKGRLLHQYNGEIKIRLPKDFSLFDGSSYDSSYPTFHNGTCSIVVGDDYNYVINTKGEKVTPTKPQPSAPEPASEYEVFRNDKGLVGVKNIKTNKIVVPAKYSSIGKSARDNNVIELHNGVVVATLDYKELRIKTRRQTMKTVFTPARTTTASMAILTWKETKHSRAKTINLQLRKTANMSKIRNNRKRV